MVWPSCGGWPSGPFRTPAPRWEMVHPDKLKGPNAGTSMLLALSKCQKYEGQFAGTSLVQHVKMEAPGVLWRSIIYCDFKSFREPSKAETEQQGFTFKEYFHLDDGVDYSAAIPDHFHAICCVTK